MWLNINGFDRIVVFDPERDTLAVLIRRLGLTGTKIGCETSDCGSCSVLLNGAVTRSCSLKMDKVKENSAILTIEGIGSPGNLHPIQQAFIYAGAVQCGFCSAGFIISTFALLEENISPTRAEVRGWFQKHRNVCRCTGYKAIVDAVMCAAEVLRGEKTMAEITFKEPENGEYYGLSLPRPSSLPRVTGQCDYGDDVSIKMPDGTLHLAVVQPRITHHANILSIDTSEAEKMPGVFRVITSKDVIGTNDMGRGPSNPRNKMDYIQELLCSKKIFRYGDVVALVAADTRDNARAAAKHVKVEIEQLPEYLSFLDAVAPGALPIHKGDNEFFHQPLFKGDHRNIKAIIEESAFHVSGSFHTTREPHMTMEGDVMQAYWDTDGMLTIQCKAQGVNMTRLVISPAIGIPFDKIRIINNPSGGSFGWPFSPFSYALAAVATIATGMPVSLSMSYEEFMHYSGKRSASYTNAALGCTADGKITGLRYDVGYEMGPYPIFAERHLVKMATLFGSPYGIANIAGLGRTAYSNHNYSAAYRGFGAPEIFMASEQIVDMLAYEAGIDPLEFRSINVARGNDTAPTSCAYRDSSAELLINEMRPLYKMALEKAKTESTPEKRRGVGVSFGVYTCGAGATDYAGCKLEVNPDDTISVYNTWINVGQGGDIGAIMVVVEALKPMGINPSQVKLRNNDTKTCPDSGSTTASRSHIMNGHAAIQTAKLMLKARDKGNGRYRTYAEMVAEGLDTVFETMYILDGVSDGLSDLHPDTGHGDPFPSYMYVLYMSEVEVDSATGKTSVLKGTIVFDVGRVGNVGVVTGQAIGGFSHSIGHALSENYADVKKHNCLSGAGVPTIDMIPDDIDVRIIEHTKSYGPFGSSGCGEVFQTSGHVSVINAIYNACGVRIYDLPALPEKVKAGLDALASGNSVDPPPYFLGSDFFETIEEITANPVAGQ